MKLDPLFNRRVIFKLHGMDPLDSTILKQDETGATECTHKLRFYSGWGIVAYALTLTYSGVLWMKATQYEFFSCIYGVYFFSDCAWIGLATIYVIAAVLLVVEGGGRGA